MWLPRLRFTLVSPPSPPPPTPPPPHSSRSPFGKIFVNFVRTDVQPRLRFNQARWRTWEPPFSPSLGENPLGPSRPMAFPRRHLKTNSHRVTLRLPDPSAGDPQAPLLPGGGEWGASAPAPVPGSARGWPSAGSPLRSGRTPGPWPSSHPPGKPTASRSVPGTQGLDSNEAPTGLCVSILH